MRVALYARVSTQSQQAGGTIGSQLAVLRERVPVEGDEPVAEFRDDGHSGARLDRPGLDALRDAAQAGLIERVWCLSPDRLARVPAQQLAYQVIMLDELARHGVSVRFTDTPPLDDDPQARLLTQVQGVIAEYERAKIAERYRRGKLFRSRAGEVLAWRTPYGYRRHPRDAHSPARLVVFEPEAAIVRLIFDDYVHAGTRCGDLTPGQPRPAVAHLDAEQAEPHPYGGIWRCRLCGADLSVGVSCSPDQRRGVVPFGRESGIGANSAACRDCGVQLGGVHHLGCAVAWCAIHDDQRLRCSCDREETPTRTAN